MSKKPKLNLGLNAYEELFIDENELLESHLPKNMIFLFKLIDDFPAHPFKEKMNEDNAFLMTSLVMLPSTLS